VPDAEIVDYDPAWPVLFGELGRTLRAALGAVALRIGHIGSTAVAGLAAKPIIDVQISVAAFEPIEAFKDPLEQLALASGPAHAPGLPPRADLAVGSPAAPQEPRRVGGRVCGSPRSPLILA
jgi:GrpB-like predicted nucleotidyltransferase (UPF0157 family)